MKEQLIESFTTLTNSLGELIVVTDRCLAINDGPALSGTLHITADAEKTPGFELSILVPRDRIYVSGTVGNEPHLLRFQSDLPICEADQKSLILFWTHKQKACAIEVLIEHK